jgi:long-chain acyl-CoA synthetase|tara:strand:- start:180 stop:1889 length:1710 start_codon:yes stop_codon:yes gene_type:complete
MDLAKTDNLLNVFFKQYIKQNSKEIFLNWLKFPEKNYSWEETKVNIIKLAKELKKNLNKGERCLLVSENRPEWLISDIAIMLAGGITVPSYITYTEKDYEFIIDDCEPTIIIVSNQILFNKLKDVIPKKKFIKKIVLFDEIKKNILSDQIIELKNILSSTLNFDENNPIINLNRKDPACIIYTSGTGGNPKGVVLSHGGILSNCEGAINLIKPILSSRTRFLTWLPLSHSYEHTVQFVQISVGAKIYYAEGIDKLLKNMSECKPEIMTAVPRFYQNLYQKINSNFKKQTGFKKKIINATISLGNKKLNKDKLNFLQYLTNQICEILVRKKIKKQFGGSLKAFVSGGGALDQTIGRFLNSVGLPTLQGYGLTEASPVVSCNPLDNIKVDTVGLPFPGNEVKLEKDGEILVKGENLMIGYWNQPEETKKVIRDGWLYTGDIGEFKSGYLKITDRKKDIIVNAGGDNISPLKVENLMTNQYEIEQCLVYGDGKNYLVALVVPSDEFINEEDKIKKKVEEINKELSVIEKIKNIIVVKEKFSIENRMLTPTLKLKRFKIIEKYKKQLENLYLK